MILWATNVSLRNIFLMFLLVCDNMLLCDCMGDQGGIRFSAMSSACSFSQDLCLTEPAVGWQPASSGGPLSISSAILPPLPPAMLVSGAWGLTSEDAATGTGAHSWSWCHRHGAHTWGWCHRYGCSHLGLVSQARGSHLELVSQEWGLTPGFLFRFSEFEFRSLNLRSEQS